MKLKKVFGLKMALLTFTCLLSNFIGSAQNDDDLFDQLDEITTEENHEVIAAFKSTRLMLGQSIERVRKGQLHFRISHVFAEIMGIQNLFGLDNLNNMHLSFEYGVTDFIQVGLSRSNGTDKTYSNILKVSLLRQKTGKTNFPLSVSYFGSLDIKTRNFTNEERNENFEGRLDFANQLLIGSKITDKLSLQVSPTWVHLNLTELNTDPNNVYSVGVGGRYLVTRSMSVNAEYFYTIPTFDNYELEKNALTFGIDLETGGHVFQLYFTNSAFLHPGKFAINKNADFFDREISFGFSMLRTFNL